MLQLSVNNVLLLPKDAAEGFNIKLCSHECQQSLICGNNSGRCVPEGDGYSCACFLNKTGAACEQGVCILWQSILVLVYMQAYIAYFPYKYMCATNHRN